MILGRYILVDHEPVLCEDLITWATWFEGNLSERRVRLTRVGPYYVSTVFLGLDHNFRPQGPPILFETMVWIYGEREITIGGKTFKHNQDFLNIQERCSTWEQALAQHEDVIRQVKAESDTVEELEDKTPPAADFTE